MRTRAQTTRDAALRRLTRVNYSLAVAAVVGAGILTDVVANTASGHARTVTATEETSGNGRVELLTSPQSTATRKPRSLRHRAVTHHHAVPASSSAAGDPPAASGSGDSSQSLQSSPAPTTVQQTQPAVQQQAQPAVQQTQPAVQQTVQPTVVAVSGGS